LKRKLWLEEDYRLESEVLKNHPISGHAWQIKEEPQLKLLHLTTVLHHIISHLILDDIENHCKSEENMFYHLTLQLSIIAVTKNYMFEKSKIQGLEKNITAPQLMFLEGTINIYPNKTQNVLGGCK
jgi:hypothetical protein